MTKRFWQIAAVTLAAATMVMAEVSMWGGDVRWGSTTLITAVAACATLMVAICYSSGPT